MAIDYSLPRRSLTALARLKSVIFDKEVTLKYACDVIEQNIRKEEYMIFEKREFDGSLRRVASLVSKRGNFKYAYRVRSRLKELMLPFEKGYGVEDIVVDGRTSVLHLDLTYDAKKIDWKHSWVRSGVDFNRYMSNLRRTFGKINVGRAFEAHVSGVCHVHVIVHFLEYSFAVASWYSKKAKGYILRVSDFERERIRKHWVRRNGFVNIQGMPNLLDGLRYLEKYIVKSSSYLANDPKNKGLKTITCNGVFGKRSFSFGKKFKESIFKRYLSASAYDLNTLSVTQTFSEQMTLGKVGELDFGVFGGVAVEKAKGVGKWVMRKRFVSKDLLRSRGGIPKYPFGEGSRFSFGLCDSQKLAVSEFFGEVGLAGSCISLASKSALFGYAERMYPRKIRYEGLTAETCRELRVLDWVKSKPKPEIVEVKPVSIESLGGLSGLALVARKLRLANDLLPAARGRVNPSLRDDGSVRFYD